MMKEKSNDILIRYNDFPVRVIAAILAAQYIVGFGQDENIFELLVLPEYYPALIASLIIAYGLVEFVYRITVFLDKRCNWDQKPIVRIILQAILGVGLPLLLSFLAAYSYFHYFYDIHISKTVYFKFYFPLIQVMLLMLNCYYGARYFERKSREGKEKRVLVSEGDIEIPEYTLGTEVGLIFTNNKSCFAKTLTGEVVSWPASMENSMNELPSALFFRIRRECIVRKDIIESVNRGGGTLILNLKAPFSQKFEVSRRNCPVFKKWWNNAIK
jgi:hypothetical protein